MLSFMPMDPRGASDETIALIARLRRGDASALEPIYRRESGPVYRYALALCANAAWSADAMQEAFVTLASQPQNFDPLRGSLGAWLAGVARHHLLARWREARREVEAADDGDGPLAHETVHGAVYGAAHGAAHSAAHDAQPDMLLMQAQDQAALWRAIQSLRWPFREALILVDLQERAYVEAAHIAGIEINTLRTRLHRARQRLAVLLRTERVQLPGVASS